MIPFVSSETFLSSKPYANISIFENDYILIQPHSTFFVYALGLIMIAIGTYFYVLRDHKNQDIFEE